MTFFVILGAVGIVLFILGLPVFRVSSLSARVDPYVGTRRPAPGNLLHGLARALSDRDPTGARRLEIRLAGAGLATSTEAFRLEQLRWAAAGSALAAVACSLYATGGGEADPTAVALFIVLAGVIGYLERDRHLSRVAGSRIRSLLDELPTAIDLLALAVMSGESIMAACSRVSEVVGGEIGDELGAVSDAVRSGRPANEALEEFAARIPDPAVARFVDALCTALDRGSPLADVLRAQADDCREARRRRLLELGGKREVLMLVPVVFLIMPVVVVIALLPGLVSLELLVP